jgi:hypothetical protein
MNTGIPILVARTDGTELEVESVYSDIFLTGGSVNGAIHAHRLRLYGRRRGGRNGCGLLLLLGP